MIWLIINAAIWAAFAAAVVVFFNAIMSLFDMVIKGIKSLFKAIKVMIMNKDGKVVDGGVLTQNENGEMSIIRDTTIVNPVPVKEVMDDPSLREAFERARPINGEKIVAVNDDQIRNLNA